MTHKFNPALADQLLRPERRSWHDPEQVLKPLCLETCLALADIGCGPGWFTLEAARRVPPGARVYGIDIQPEMLDRVRARVKDAGLTNVEAVLAEEEDEYPVPTESMDAALIVDVYHEVDPGSLFLTEVRRILKPGGRCLVVDWRPEPTPLGPRPERRIDPADVCSEFEAAGFVLLDTPAIGPYHYGLLFIKKSG